MADQQPIIIKKVYKSGGGHGGGTWKIAYADFVTAMMAFFLLMWLLNSVTQEQLEGISDYFAPTTASTSASGSGDVLAGKTIGEEGVSETDASRPSVIVDLPPPKAGTSESEDDDDNDPTAKKIEELQKQQEEDQFKEAERAIQEAIQGVPQLKDLANSLMIDNTPEGLRIQLVDQEGLAMFPSGEALMHPHTRKALGLVSKVILEMPQDVAISGHTDSVKFSSDDGYSNWELSADRANNARRVMKDFGVSESRVARVVGRADNEPLLPDDPKNARNRRLSIVLLRGSGKQPVPTVPSEPAPDKVNEMQIPTPQPPAPLPEPEATHPMDATTGNPGLEIRPSSNKVVIPLNN